MNYKYTAYRCDVKEFGNQNAYPLRAAVYDQQKRNFIFRSCYCKAKGK